MDGFNCNNLQETSPKGVAFISTDGTKLCIVVGDAGVKRGYSTLSAGFDVSTSTYLTQVVGHLSMVSAHIAVEASVWRYVAFNTDGTKMFILGSNGS